MEEYMYIQPYGNTAAYSLYCAYNLLLKEISSSHKWYALLASLFKISWGADYIKHISILMQAAFLNPLMFYLCFLQLEFAETFTKHKTALTIGQSCVGREVIVCKSRSFPVYAERSHTWRQVTVPLSSLFYISYPIYTTIIYTYSCLYVNTTISVYRHERWTFHAYYTFTMPISHFVSAFDLTSLSSACSHLATFI